MRTSTDGRMEDRIRNGMKAALNQVHAEDALKQNTKTFLSRKTGGYQRRRLFWPSRSIGSRKLAPVLTCLFIITLGIGGYFSYFTPVSAISVEVNPIIDLGINRFDKVVSVKGENEDGQQIVESLDLLFSDYTDALDDLLAADSMKQYMTPEYTVSITVIGPDDKKSEAMRSRVTEASETVASHKNVHCHAGSTQEAEAAQAAGMSMGKYRAFQELQELDPSVTEEDVQRLSVREIRVWIRELQGDRDAEQSAAEADRSDAGRKSGAGEGHRGHGYGKAGNGGQGHGHRGGNGRAQ